MGVESRGEPQTADLRHVLAVHDAESAGAHGREVVDGHVADFLVYVDLGLPVGLVGYLRPARHADATADNGLLVLIGAVDDPVSVETAVLLGETPGGIQEVVSAVDMAAKVDDDVVGHG